MVSTSQRIAMAILPKITGFSSAFFSLAIVVIVLRGPKRRGQTFHRLMAALSLVDVSTSFWTGMSTWPTPRANGAIFAMGTEATCKLQGFFINMSVTSVLYNLSLSVYYLMVIRFGWKDDAIKRIEPLLHGIPLAWGICTGIVALKKNALDFATLWCWIPSEFSVLRWIFLYGPLFFCFGAITVNCYLTWSHVHNLELSVAKYRFRMSRRFPISTTSPDQVSTAGETASNHTASEDKIDVRKVKFGGRLQSRKNSVIKSNNSRKMAKQCILYTGGFYATWLAMFIVRFMQIFDATVPIQLIILGAFSAPMQGLPNVLIYLLPEIKKMRKSNPRLGWVRGFILAIFHKTTVGGSSMTSSIATSVAENNVNVKSSLKNQDGNDKNSSEQDPTLEDDNRNTMTEPKKNIHLEQITKSEAERVEIGEQPGTSRLDSSTSKDIKSSMMEGEADDKKLDELDAPNEQSNSSSGFLKMWMDRRCGNGWEQQDPYEDTSNDFIPATIKSSNELTVGDNSVAHKGIEQGADSGYNA